MEMGFTIYVITGCNWQKCILIHMFKFLFVLYDGWTSNGLISQKKS